MLAFFAFFITIIGNLNWLCIGFFQFDFIAGLFGTQSSIFSRFIYIVFGVASVFLTYAVIRYKGRLTIKKNINQDKVLKMQQQLPENYNANTQLINDNNIYTNTPPNATIYTNQNFQNESNITSSSQNPNIQNTNN
ncbi:MAG: DUF378 domain-containing protein [Clostridiales bacterium]|nr:DUF378 domain-containing protein [Clostridiales bacterium]